MSLHRHFLEFFSIVLPTHLLISLQYDSPPWFVCRPIRINLYQHLQACWIIQMPCPHSSYRHYLIPVPCALSRFEKGHHARDKCPVSKQKANSSSMPSFIKVRRLESVIESHARISTTCALRARLPMSWSRDCLVILVEFRLARGVS